MLVIREFKKRLIMSTKLNKEAYQELTDGNLAWLSKQDDCLEKAHVVEIVRSSTDTYYPSENKWNTSCVPKDGTTILGDFGYQLAMVAMWNVAENGWIVASPQHSNTELGLDSNFDSEYFSERELRKWQPMPTQYV